MKAGQLTDYVAMVALAEIKPEAVTGQAPTILKRFDPDAPTRPAGLSSWDRALLKALYRTSQDNRSQNSEIAGSILRELERDKTKGGASEEADKTDPK